MKKLNLTLALLATSSSILPGQSFGKMIEEHPKAAAGAVIATGTAVVAIAAKRNLIRETRYVGYYNQTGELAEIREVDKLVIKRSKPTPIQFQSSEPGKGMYTIERHIMAKIDNLQRNNPYTQAHIPKLNLNNINAYLQNKKSVTGIDLSHEDFFANPYEAFPVN